MSIDRVFATNTRHDCSAWHNILILVLTIVYVCMFTDFTVCTKIKIDLELYCIFSSFSNISENKQPEMPSSSCV